MFNNDKRSGDKQPPLNTIEDEVKSAITNEIARARKAGTGQVLNEVKAFAPPLHPDRVSHATQMMVDTIDSMYRDCSIEIDNRVADFSAKLEELKRSAEHFKTKMRQGADQLIEKVKGLGADFEDITAKMQESDFGKPVRKLLEKPTPSSERRRGALIEAAADFKKPDEEPPPAA